MCYNEYKMKARLHIADAKKIFTEKDCLKIRNGVERAEKYTAPRLGIKEDIDIIVTPNLPDFLIPEDHLGAFTYNGNFMLLSFEHGYVVEDLVYEVVCHEMCHAARWQKSPEDMESLFDGMILEGLAICFEAQAVREQKQKQFFLETMLKRSDAENERILKILKDELDNKYYDSYTIFIAGNKQRNLPRWSGYSLGYYLVKKYLAETGKIIEGIYDEPYQDFRTPAH